MNHNFAIRVENLGKRYKIGAREDKYRTLRDTLTRILSYPVSLLRRSISRKLPSGPEYFWALKNVSIDFKPGEVVGIIGRNGAGKTTLLKILSRITEPTEGRVKVYGRVASLLEVGVGFHPELTGRENIYLNGAILGMRKAEIVRKFDEIVAFAEVEQFLDTPVKRYSSGMYVRLAFAVAAHLEPEILLVDEVLAVGDAAFQNKCLGKMDQISQEGRTVFLVSHNMGAIRQLCPRAILLDRGELIADGESGSIIDRYLRIGNDQAPRASLEINESSKRSGIGGGKILRIEVEDKDGNPSSVIGVGDPLGIKLHVTLMKKLASLVVGLEVKTHKGIPLLNLRSDSLGQFFGPYAPGSNVMFTFKIPSMPFYPGIYRIEPWFGEKLGRRIDHLHDAINITLEPKGNYKSEIFIQKGKGMVLMDFECFDKEITALNDSRTGDHRLLQLR